MDIQVLRSYFPLFQTAAGLTVRLGAEGIFLALLVGLICAAVRYWKIPVFCQIASFYI